MKTSKKLVNILSIALIYCGAVFGAGFASGREIFSFFSCYKLWGIVSSLFAGFLFSFFGYHICKYARKEKVYSADEYLLKLFPEYLSRFFSFIINAFLVLSFCIMITGCGTLFSEQFNAPTVLGAVLSLLVCFLVLKNKVSGLEKFNFIATPFMIVGILFLGFLSLKLPKESVLETAETVMPFASGLLYVSYNMVSAVAVIVSIAKICEDKRDAAIGGMLGGILIALPLVLLGFVLAQHWEVASYPMPFFALIYNNFPKVSIICSIVSYFAMLTTAVSSGVGVLANLGEIKNGKYAFLLCIAAFFISFLPFAQLVLTVYSAFGLIGCVLVIRILVEILRK